MVDINNDIKTCVATLQQGGVLLYPTDTIWGLGCDATNEKAVEKIFQIKQRPKEKSVIILLADVRDIVQYVAAPDPSVFDFLEARTTPTTIIFQNAIGLADNVMHEDGSIAIRVVKDNFCKTIIKQLGHPLVSTSANFSGQATAKTFQEIDTAIIAAVDYTAQYRREDESIKMASSIFKLNDTGDWQQLR